MKKKANKIKEINSNIVLIYYNLQININFIGGITIVIMIKKKNILHYTIKTIIFIITKPKKG